MRSNCNTDYLNYKSEFQIDDVAVYDSDEKIHYTYGDLERRSNILGNYLKNEVGINKADRVAFCSRNRIELIDAYFATAKIGAILTTYNPCLSEKTILDMVNNETPEILFYENEFSAIIDFLKKAKVSIKAYVNLSRAIKTIDIGYEEMLDSGDQKMIASQNDLEDIHMIIHTGGTTGAPKGAMLSYRSLLFNALSEIIALNISKDDVAFVAMPFFHTAGWNVLTIPILLVGGRIVLTKQFQPERALEIIETEKVTAGICVATMLRMIMNSPRFNTTDYSSLRWILSGGASTPDDILNHYWEKGIKLVKAYGMTEIGPNNLAIAADNMSIEEIKKIGNSVGKPLPFNQVRIVNEQRKNVKTGEIGELIWGGSLIFSGYWNNPLETENVCNDGWVSTGDLARRDESGYYHIVGRKKNMYISGGENIFPLEIENAISSYAGIHEVVVIGVADEKWGEVGKAIIELEANIKISEDDLRNYISNQLGSLKTPKYFEFIEKIPKNSTGKIQMNELIKRFGTIQKKD